MGISGSLRAKSYNTAVLIAASKMVPAGSTIELVDISKLPPFNQDIENNMPQGVLDFKQKVKESDAILFSTPEYNYSIPGVLKNAIDWASRPYGNNSWYGKPAGIMSSSIGMVGGARAQYHLRQVMVFLNMFPLNRPEVIIPMVNEKINDAGEITDEKTKEKISEMVNALTQNGS